MINFWGDFTFYVFFREDALGALWLLRLAQGAFSFFAVLDDVADIKNDCARPFSQAGGRARLSLPGQGGAAQPVICMIHS